MDCFICSMLIGTDPNLNVVRGGGRESSSEVRRGVERAAVGGAVLCIPECSVVRTITEIVVTNEGRGEGSLRTVSVVAWTAKTIMDCAMPCGQTPDMLT